MKTRFLPLLALAAALSACHQENQASLEFYGICDNPKPDGTTGGCTYTSSCALYALFTYWYDPISASELLVPIEMFNQLPNNADLSAGRVNTNDAVIQEWRFEYLLGGILFADATSPDNVVVPAGSHKTAIVPVFPASMNALMSAFPSGTTFVVNVRAAGRYLDDRYFETGPFRVPAAVKSPYTTYAPPPTCTAPAYAAACPQIGQSATYGCVTP